MPRFLLNGVDIGNFKGVLFDKDGTLSCSENHLKEITKLRIEESVKELTKNNFTKDDIRKFKDLIKEVYGLDTSGLNPQGAVAIASRHDNLISTATIFSTIGMDWSEAITIASDIFLRVDKRNAISEVNNNQRPLLPGVICFLNKLKVSGVKCALITNDNAKGVDNFIQFNDLEDKFSGYWSCDDQPAKPSPDSVKKLCETLQLNPSECVLIGDSDLDMQMAKKARIGLAIGYVSGWNIKPKLSHQNKIIFNWDDISCL